MKNIKFVPLYFAVLLLLGYSVPARAQDTSAKSAHSEMHHGQRGSSLEWLSKELNLTDDQKAKVRPILEDEGKQMKAVREDSSLSQEQKHDKMRQIHEAAHSQINELLTPEQQQKFAQLKEQHKEHHEGNKPDESKQPQL